MQKLLLVTLILVGKSLESSPGLNPNTGLNMTQLVTKYNYPIETHEVQTEDGYILTIFRIPHGRNATNSKQTTKPVILLMHGLLSSSADWVSTGPEKALGLILADAGYDVWMGNQRGNTHSQKHVNLDYDIDKRKFFNFTWHEIGYYDLPAKIDYILDATQQETLFYLGVSQGTTVFFVMASDRPEYNEKIRLMAAFAPVTYINNAKSPVVRVAAEDYLELAVMFDISDIHEFLPYNEIYLDIAKRVCDGSAEQPDACLRAVSYITGFDVAEWDPTIMTVITSNVPAGCSVGQLKHYLQVFNSGRFQHYHHDIFMNMEKYGTKNPPVYDLTKVTAPVAVYCGQNDWLSSLTDVQRLTDELPNVVVNRRISYPKFNHMDFIYAVNVVELLYNDVLSDLKKYLSPN